MKIAKFGFFLCLLCCFISGILGAYSVTLFQARKEQKDVLELRKLELVDVNKNVRAVFSVEADGNVVLRMLSKENLPALELGAANPSVANATAYAPSGYLTIRDSKGNITSTLSTLGRNEGSLLFYGPSNRVQVAVGYSHYGDTVDGHDRGRWGLDITQPTHHEFGVGVFAEDGVIKGSTAPLEAPPLANAK